jgi:hypothetical protein
MDTKLCLLDIYHDILAMGVVPQYKTLVFCVGSAECKTLTGYRVCYRVQF